MDGETFIGGFAGGFLAKGFHIGYGIYFTTRRLFGIDLGKSGGGALGGTMAGFIQGELMPKLSPEENSRVIGMLDGIKEFELMKEQIRRIELHKVGLLGTGHFVIQPVEGETKKITLRHRTAYDRLVSLTQAFGPELVSQS
jgi:hypothetical protein